MCLKCVQHHALRQSSKALRVMNELTQPQNLQKGPGKPNVHLV